MEVVAATPNGGESSPFHNHDVREWSRVDNLTGVLERARRETDHWTSNTNNSSHKYGKVVDCRARSCVDGNLQQEAKRQLEVFQSQIPGSRLQVIKTNTVSSSRWTTKSTQDSHEHKVQPFDGLQFNTTLLDVNAQKSKITAGRAAGRRPISKQSSIRQESTIPKFDDASVTSLHRVSRLCQQIHDSAVKHYLKRPTLHERQTSNSSVEISDAESNVKSNENSRLTRTKSTSSEDLDVSQDQLRSHLIEDEKSRKSIKDLEDLETLRGWRRTSKVRRSLQLPKENKASSKPPDLPENNGSVRRIREDLEKGRRLNTALRGNHVNLEALDQILQSISSSSVSDKKIDEVENLSSDKEDDETLKKQKRNSFVTVESIKEVRNRLRRTSSPTTNIYKDNKEESDDGIVTEDSNMPLQEDSFPTKVRSYIYGMENNMSKMSVNGTGSLESRSKHLNGSFAIRNEDWYNRRKSYGFEKMQQEDIISSKPKNTESSTDSGICRSSEIVSPPNLTHDTAKSASYNSSNSKLNSWLSSEMKEINGTTITVPISSKLASLNNGRHMFQNSKDSNIGHWRENEDITKRHSIAVDESEYVTKLPEPKLRKTSLAINTNDLYLDNEDNQFFLNRKPKKVEFCKTEVHFTAESGKVNIVETDEKPPPTQNFRRRRRNSGLIIDDFKNNDLPEFKFGDDILNDEEFGINENIDLENIFAGLVTVTSNSTNILHDIEEDLKESLDSELPKGILKNKPIKPKPYLLGDTESLLYNNFDNGQTAPWDVKLKAVRDETPMWRSSITVKNTLYGKTTSNNDERLNQNKDYKGNDMQIPEFQKLLKNLKPVPKAHQDFEEVRNSFNGIRIISPNNDARRSSWSVSDCIKQVEDLQLTEGKGYSTKINFGNGETTVIENNNTKQVTRHPTWPRREETSNALTLNNQKQHYYNYSSSVSCSQQCEQPKQISDDRERILKKGLVVRIGKDDIQSACSKTTTNHTSHSTTTKITIDLAPSPTNGKAIGELNSQSTKLPKTSLPCFKSTSLVLNTIKIEQLRTDTEKQSNDLDVKSKIHNQLEALKKLYEDVYSDSEADTEVQNFMSKSLNSDSKIDEECSSVLSGSWSRVSALKNISNYNNVNVKSRNRTRTNLHAQLEKDLDRMQINTNIDLKHSLREQSKTEGKLQSIHESKGNGQLSNSLTRSSTLASKTTNNDNLKFQVKKLSSPGLVGKNVMTKQVFCDTKHEDDLVANGKTFSERNIAKKGSLEKQKHRKLEGISTQGIRNKSPHKEVLRQPKKSEMAYFGVPPSPKLIKQDNKKSKLSEKPDLLQFHENKKEAVHIGQKNHIYENVENVKKQSTLSRKKREFDSNILEELTKAADQILQAVNDYANEDSRHKLSADEEERRKKHRHPLDTISETKSWKQNKADQTRTSQQQSKTSTKTKIRQTSSNSSIESVNKDVRRTSTVHKSTSSVDQKIKRKTTNNDNAAVKANTKARRLQRASSREALLQSHGSSSEDLPAVIEVPIRKHRLARKNKSNSLGSNSTESKTVLTNSSKKREDKEHRTTTSCLPEIRHKTAVSTIRSTAEKATREKTNKLNTTESRRKGLHKQDPQGTPGPKCDRNKSSSNKDSNRRPPSSNHKKCSRYEASLK